MLGCEVANAYSELGDPREQRRRCAVSSSLCHRMNLFIFESQLPHKVVYIEILS